jgi:hypothetical protein
MALLVFITGKQGAGKSCIAKEWVQSRRAKRINVDAILERGALEIPGFSASRDSPTSWGLWEGVCRETRKSCLDSGFAGEYSTLRGYAGDLVVEGAILCNDWFYKSMKEVLLDWMPARRDVHHFYLDVSNRQLLENVRERARSDPKRRKRELQLFPDEEAVAKKHEGFDRQMAASTTPWEPYSSREDLEAALERL